MLPTAVNIPLQQKSVRECIHIDKVSDAVLTNFSFSVSPPRRPSACRAFKINELKTEVTNRLAMLEKRVECKSVPTTPLSYLHTCVISCYAQKQESHLSEKKKYSLFTVGVF